MLLNTIILVISIIDDNLGSLAWFLLVPGSYCALIGSEGDEGALSLRHSLEGWRLHQPQVTTDNWEGRNSLSAVN